MEEIQSKYSIKKYIKKEWVELLESIDINLIDIKTDDLIIPTLKLSVVDLLKKKFNTTIDNLDKITSRSKKHLDQLVDCDKILNDTTNPVKLDILKKAYSNNFMSIPVIHWIELKGLIVKKVNFLNINLTIVDDKTTSQDLIDHIIKIIVWLLKISNNPSHPIDIYIFLCPEEKHMESSCLDVNSDTNTDQCKLSRTNINSGASWSGNWVQIFRSEEVLKVLIHEIIHYLVLDVQDHSNKIDSYCSHLKMHKDSNKILVNEAYTEFLAIYMHTIYLSVHKNSGVFDEDIFWNIYLQEEKFTIYQINKIFLNYSIPGIQFFAKKNNFVQYTNVISYFIIKYLFFINTKYFLILYGDTQRTIQLIKYLLERFFNLKIPQVNISLDTSLRMSYGSLI
jgi:hypothetical protein